MTISDHLVVRTVNGKTMIVNIKNGQITVIDEIGTFFWRAMSRGCKEEIFENILSQYKVSEETLSKDYDAFVNKMKELELIW